MGRTIARACAVAWMLACGCKGGDASSAAPSADAGTDARLDPAGAAAARASCAFARGALAADTLGTGAPVGGAIPIDTIVVLMQENRSFDSYFSHLGKYAGRTDIDGAPDSTTNPASVGTIPGPSHPYQHADHLCSLDTNHEWLGTHLEWDDGKNDGFYQENEGWDTGDIPDGGSPLLADGERALWWYDERDLPFYYALAATFAVGDAHFSATLGPTWPNRMFSYAATSFGKTTNDYPDLTNYAYPKNDAVIFDSLEKAGVSWAIVNETLPGAAVVVGPAVVNRWGRDPIITYDEFYARAAAGSLPHVVYFDPHLGRDGDPNGDDEHPPANIQHGQKLVSDVVHALFASPQWPHLALFLTYDEHGGFYDHVPPPKACPPDGTPPALLDPNEAPLGAFDRYGFRVPFTVVSAYAKKSYVSHVVSDHTSVLRFIEARFALPALSARDANADPLFDYFDFASAAFVPPPEIAAPAIDPAEDIYCTRTFTK